MRQDPKYKLLSTDSAERAAQETDAVLATTARLIKEMAVLIEQSQDLLKRHEALLQATRSAKIDKK